MKDYEAWLEHQGLTDWSCVILPSSCLDFVDTMAGTEINPTSEMYAFLAERTGVVQANSIEAGGWFWFSYDNLYRFYFRDPNLAMQFKLIFA